VGERGTTMAAHGERKRLQADPAARVAGGPPGCGLLFTSSRAFPRSRKNPGPLINALNAWLTAGPPAPPVTESWLLGAPDSPRHAANEPLQD
jgi:hypothetical protein